MGLFGALKLRRYAVTLRGSPMREFMTLDGALTLYLKHRTVAFLYRWRDGEWVELRAPVQLTKFPQ